MKGRKPIDLDLKMIRFSYEELGSSLKEIAEGLQVSERIIRNRLVKMGVQIRSVQEHYELENERVLDSIDAAARYVVGESQRTLSSESRVPPESLRRYLIRKGVHIRTRAEQIKMWHKQRGN